MLHKNQDRKKKIKINLCAQFCMLCSLLGRVGIFPGYSRRTTKTKYSWQAEFYFRKIGWGSACCKLRPGRLNHLLKLILSSANIHFFILDESKYELGEIPLYRISAKVEGRFKVSVPALPINLGEKVCKNLPPTANLLSHGSSHPQFHTLLNTLLHRKPSQKSWVMTA